MHAGAAGDGQLSDGSMVPLAAQHVLHLPCHLPGTTVQHAETKNAIALLCFCLLLLANCCSPSGLPRTAVVGVLGGGQLGRMMALAAVRPVTTSKDTSTVV
jgi:hypothetical protein